MTSIKHQLNILGKCISYNFTGEVVLASRVVDLGLESQSGQTKDYEIGICCFSPTQQFFSYIMARRS
jgi:hypothetical protein